MKKMLKNKIVAASLLFLLLDLAGAFLVLSPFLVFVRSHLDKSELAKALWPVISPSVLSNLFVNDTRVISIFIISGLIIFFVYSLLWTLFEGGIYHIIVFDGIERPEIQPPRPFRDFLARCAIYWPAFMKIAILSIPVYLIAVFLGISAARILSGLGLLIMLAAFLLFMLLASTYLQILKIQVVLSDDTSVRGAMRATKPAVARLFLRFLAGNISVAIVGLMISLLFWIILKNIRAHDWSVLLAIISVILQQAIALVICLMQSVRINFNHSLIKKGIEDALGGTQLGGV